MTTKFSLIAAIAVTAVLAGAITYVTVRQNNLETERALNEEIMRLEADIKSAKSASETTPEVEPPTTLTGDQIFAEVEKELGLTRSKLSYFRIFGQDRVQFSESGGNTYAYKTDGVWKIAGPRNQLSLTDCDGLEAVPTKYRPPCSKGSSNSSERLYLDSAGGSLNYPLSEMSSYIGQ